MDFPLTIYLKKIEQKRKHLDLSFVLRLYLDIIYLVSWYIIKQKKHV